MDHWQLSEPQSKRPSLYRPAPHPLVAFIPPGSPCASELLRILETSWKDSAPITGRPVRRGLAQTCRRKSHRGAKSTTEELGVPRFPHVGVPHC